MMIFVIVLILFLFALCLFACFNVSAKADEESMEITKKNFEANERKLNE